MLKQESAPSVYRVIDIAILEMKEISKCNNIYKLRKLKNHLFLFIYKNQNYNIQFCDDQNKY